MLAASYEALLIGGRAGVGKTTVGWEISAQLQALRIAHCLIEGDNLDQAFPAPADDPARTKMTEANLAALWRNYAALGYRRLIYTNTVSVLEPDLIARAMGSAPRITAVLLTADDATARQRLDTREIGSQLGAHITRSTAMAQHLEATAPSWVARVSTDARSITDIARDAIAATNWATQPSQSADHDLRLEY
ncbi:AAA family ATPase [Streptomyces sp. BE230]|uniref:AAA family ATPase n=1 Tax=Streptomyces sp. BE230 TaxID=3002526 RepID=UPI002ED6A13E|nr:AAA family ATPase [Streptomyces sp. BE230]